MYISKIKIENYKGFNNHDVIELKKGINLIIGKNNSGKTALLEALTFRVNKPHLSEKNKPRVSSALKTYSTLTGRLTINYQDFISFVEDNLKNEVILPTDVIDHKTLTWAHEIDDHYYMYCDEDEDKYEYIDKLYSYIPKTPIGSENWNEKDWDDHWNDSWDPSKEEMDTERYIGENSIRIDETEINDFINSFFQKGVSFTFINQSKFFLSLPNDKTTQNMTNVKLKVQEGKLVFATRKINDAKSSCEEIVKHFIEKNIYKFDVFRKFHATSSISDETKLNSDCSNLVSVLHKFKNSDPISFEKYKKALKNILGIEELIFETIKSTVEIKIWNTEPIGGRPDLAISLDDCGTGVGQVLAILYVVISSIEPKVILIDEPNSFLHPSASRKLMEILTEYPQHQYFITTHSPELISNFGDNILHTQLIDGEIKVKQIDKKDKNEIESIFSDLGIRLSDVYGFDSVFWVEGETEEKCLPLILRKHGVDISNSAFLSVKNTGGTGKFDKDYINNTVKIYNKLSLIENTYTPPAIGFFFDSEGKNVEEVKSKLGKTDKEKVIFTDKKLYENYLLNIDAIFQLLENEKTILLEITEENQFPFSKESIEKWIEENKFNKDYWENREPNEIQKSNWKNEIHAAKLLGDLFLEVFKTVNPYKKTKHSELLTKIILELEPKAFDEFVNKIKPLIEKAS